jgi:hypothetical protein
MECLRNHHIRDIDALEEENRSGHLLQAALVGDMQKRSLGLLHERGE